MLKKTASFVGVMALIMGAGVAQAADVKKGSKQFRKCKACHKVEAGQNAVGPHLAGIVGRPIASVADFKYSKAMVEHAGKVGNWSIEELDAYLANPRKHVKGTKMSFPGIKKEDQRADLLAYLETLK